MLRGLKSVEPIRVVGLKDPELSVRLAATHALGQLGDGAGPVGVAMSDENVRVRLEAVRQLGGSLGDARGLHDFGLQVSSRSNYVRVCILSSILSSIPKRSASLPFGPGR